MRNAIHFLRRAIINKLQGNITINNAIVPVYNRIPTDANYPLIRVYGVSTDEVTQNQTSYITENITRIECISRFYSDDGGDLNNDLMVSQILELIRTRSDDYVNLTANGFKVYTSELNSVNYLQDDLPDYTYFRAIIEISNKIEQITPIVPPLEYPLQSELQLPYPNDYVNRVNTDNGNLEGLECIDSKFLYNL